MDIDRIIKQRNLAISQVVAENARLAFIRQMENNPFLLSIYKFFNCKIYKSYIRAKKNYY